MKRIMFLGSLIIIVGMLAGCIGGGSPTDSHDQTDSHDVIDSHDRTNTQTQTANPEQTGNRPVCVGMVVIGGCNTTQEAEGPSQSASPVMSGDEGEAISDLLSKVTMPGMGVWAGLLVCAIAMFMAMSIIILASRYRVGGE